MCTQARTCSLHSVLRRVDRVSTTPRNIFNLTDPTSVVDEKQRPLPHGGEEKKQLRAPFAFFLHCFFTHSQVKTVTTLLADGHFFFLLLPTLPRSNRPFLTTHTATGRHPSKQVKRPYQRPAGVGDDFGARTAVSSAVLVLAFRRMPSGWTASDQRGAEPTSSIYTSLRSQARPHNTRRRARKNKLKRADALGLVARTLCQTPKVAESRNVVPFSTSRLDVVA